MPQTWFVVVERLARKELTFSDCHHAAICSKACFCLQLHTLSPLPVARSPSLAAGGSSLLGCFCWQLHILSPLPVALSPSPTAGLFRILVCFWRQLHTLSPMPVALSPSLGLRWRLVALASWVVFVNGYTLWALCHFCNQFGLNLGSLRYFAPFLYYLGITLGSV